MLILLRLGKKILLNTPVGIKKERSNIIKKIF